MKKCLRPKPETKTYIILYIYKTGNGYALVNAYTPNQAESIFRTLTSYRDKYQGLKVILILESKYPGDETQLIEEGNVNTSGKNAYDLAVLNGFTGTYELFMASLKGEPGRDIVSIIKTSTDGLVDTYTITYSSGTPLYEYFTIRNGATKTSELTNDSNFIQDSHYVHTDNNYTSQEKTKLGGIEAGAEVNVQSDWNQTITTADDYIKNKPTIDAALSSSSTNAVLNKVVTAALVTKVNTANLASVSDGIEGATLVGYGTKTEGGTTTNVSVKDALDEIYESIGDGGDLATRVTALEEGKEDKFFIITVTVGYDSQTDKYTILSCDRTMDEMTEAYALDKKMLVLLKKGTVTYLVPLAYADEKDGKEHVNNFYFVGYSNKKDESIRCIFPGSVAEAAVEITRLQTKLTFDNSPTANSSNPVKSGGVYSALQEKKDNDFFVKYVVEYGILTDFELQIVSVDKTYAEVKEAYEQGKTLIGVFAYRGRTEENYLSLINTVQSDSDYEFRFTKCGEDGEVLSIYMDKAVNKAYRSNPHRVKQSPVSSNEDFPMLLAGQSGISSTKTTYTKYDTDLKYNPSTNTLKLGTGTLTATNYSGTSAKATNDADGNPISSTYLKVSDLITGDGGETLLSNITAMSERATVEALNDKLDTISDLSIIRAGAAAGATAYQKPSTGIPKSDLSSSVLTSLGKADTALQQHQDLSSYADGAEYDSTNHLIYLKHGSTRLANPINASDFIKDGMVDTVEVTGGNLVITFNTDSGKLPITIPISDIFDANNYYNKTESDARYLLSFTETDPIFSASPAAGITPSDIDYWDNKLNKITPPVVGSLYRNDVSGSGGITIRGTKGLFPTVTSADTYTVVTKMLSSTQSYGLSVNFGDNTYTLNTTNGLIEDTRQITVNAGATWSGSVVGNVATNTILDIKLFSSLDEITTVGMTAITNSYNDLDNKPTIPTVYNGKLTIQKNGTQVATFTANQSSNVTANIIVPTKVSELDNDSGFITGYTETDPTVPSWAKQSTKPSYTASEVGALPSTTFIPSKTSDLTNDSGFITGYTETDPTVPSWAKLSTKPSYNYSEINNTPSLATVATSGSYNDLSNKPTIPTVPTNVSAFTNDAGYLTTHQDISGKQDILTAGNGIAIDNNDTIRTTGIPYGVVDSTSTSKVFTATVPGIDRLEDGVCVMLKNGVVTSAAGFTININGLGAKPAFNNMTAATRETTIFNINYTMLFVYDATRVVDSITGAWVCYRGYDANTNTIGFQLRTNSTVMTVTDTARYYKIYFTSADGAHWVPASVNSTNNATSARAVNQRPINPFGRIVFTSANSNYAAGANLAATTIWDQYTLTLGYSFNRTGAALTLTTNTPVYVKCAPQTNGSAIMDADTPIVQALPTTNDGKIYIFLGIAYNATNIELYNNHPVYYHDGTGIRLWTGSTGGGGDLSNYYTKTEVDTALSGKQATLVSGTNLKTVNSTSLLGSGNVSVQPTLVSGTNIKTINNESLLGSGNISIQGGGGSNISISYDSNFNELVINTQS